MANHHPSMAKHGHCHPYPPYSAVPTYQVPNKWYQSGSVHGNMKPNCPVPRKTYREYAEFSAEENWYQGEVRRHYGSYQPAQKPYMSVRENEYQESPFYEDEIPKKANLRRPVSKPSWREAAEAMWGFRRYTPAQEDILDDQYVEYESPKKYGDVKPRSTTSHNPPLETTGGNGGLTKADLEEFRAAFDALMDDFEASQESFKAEMKAMVREEIANHHRVVESIIKRLDKQRKIHEVKEGEVQFGDDQKEPIQSMEDSPLQEVDPQQEVETEIVDSNSKEAPTREKNNQSTKEVVPTREWAAVYRFNSTYYKDTNTSKFHQYGNQKEGESEFFILYPPSAREDKRRDRFAEVKFQQLSLWLGNHSRAKTEVSFNAISQGHGVKKRRIRRSVSLVLLFQINLSMLLCFQKIKECYNNESNFDLEDKVFLWRPGPDVFSHVAHQRTFIWRRLRSGPSAKSGLASRLSKNGSNLGSKPKSAQVILSLPLSPKERKDRPKRITHVSPSLEGVSEFISKPLDQAEQPKKTAQNSAARMANRRDTKGENEKEKSCHSKGLDPID